MVSTSSVAIYNLNFSTRFLSCRSLGVWTLTLSMALLAELYLLM